MKKMICILLVLILLVLPGCVNPSEDAYKRPAYFYYPRNDILLDGKDGVITYELREAAHIASRKELLKYYFEGPDSSALYSPFPEESSVLECTFFGNTLYVSLSHHFDELTGMPFTIATTCIAMTLFASTNYTVIEFEILGEDGQILRSFTLARDQVLVEDTHIALPGE